MRARRSVTKPTEKQKEPSLIERDYEAERLIQDLKSSAFRLTSFALDHCHDRDPRKKRYWLEMGVKLESLHQAVEALDRYETIKERNGNV